MAAQKFSCDSYPRCPSTNDANVGSDASPVVELMQVFDHLVVSLLSSRAADRRCDSQRNTSYIIQFLGTISCTSGSFVPKPVGCGLKSKIFYSRKSSYSSGASTLASSRFIDCLRPLRAVSDLSPIPRCSDGRKEGGN